MIHFSSISTKIKVPLFVTLQYLYLPNLRMKYVKGFVAAFFILVTYWQFNDAEQYGNHDFIFWVIFYLATSGITIITIFRKLPSWLLPTALGFCLGATLFRIQDGVGNFDTSAIFRAEAVPAKMNATTQMPNEAGGLLLVATWFIILLFLQKKKPSRK